MLGLLYEILLKSLSDFCVGLLSTKGIIFNVLGIKSPCGLKNWGWLSFKSRTMIPIVPVVVNGSSGDWSLTTTVRR